MTPAERTQREYELWRAYTAAQTLAERLELAGLDELAKQARGIREGVWREEASLAYVAGRASRNEVRLIVHERFVTDEDLEDGSSLTESELRALAGDR